MAPTFGRTRSGREIIGATLCGSEEMEAASTFWGTGSDREVIDVASRGSGSVSSCSVLRHAGSANGSVFSLPERTWISSTRVAGSCSKRAS